MKTKLWSVPEVLIISDDIFNEKTYNLVNTYDHTLANGRLRRLCMFYIIYIDYSYQSLWACIEDNITHEAKVIFCLFVFCLPESSVLNKCCRNNVVNIKLSLCHSLDKCSIVWKKPSARIWNPVGCSVPTLHKEMSTLLCQCSLTRCFRQMRFPRREKKVLNP